MWLTSSQVSRYAVLPYNVSMPGDPTPLKPQAGCNGGEGCRAAPLLAFMEAVPFAGPLVFRAFITSARRRARRPTNFLVEGP